MKDRVYLHGDGKVEFISMGANSLQDLKSAKSFMVEFLGGADSPDVLGQEPDFVAGVQDRWGASVFISLFRVCCISPLDLSLKLFFQLVQVVDK